MLDSSSEVNKETQDVQTAVGGLVEKIDPTGVYLFV